MKRVIFLSLVVLIVSLFTFTVIHAVEGENAGASQAAEGSAEGGHKVAPSSDAAKIAGKIAAAIALGLGAFGTAMVQAKVGSAGVGTIAEKPETVGSVIILMALPETIVILGFVIAAMLILM